MLSMLPYLLISTGLALLISFGVDAIVSNNIYYRLITNVPDDTSSVFLDLKPKTEEEKKKLEENNTGNAFSVRPEFPPIALGEKWATITIESIGLIDGPVFHGDYLAVLRKGIGHYDNSSFPGQGGKVVLSAHVNKRDIGFFDLETMTGGETVVLKTIYGEYVYKVRETIIFNETDPSYILPNEFEDEETLICYTCYPYVTTSVRTKRFAIICDLVSGEDWRTGDK